MIRIVSDTATLYSTSEGEKEGIYIAPLSVTINNKTYEELNEIQTKEFVDIIKQGHLPLSSQPSIGRVVDIYNRFPEDEILNITMADGLSGTYNSAISAKSMVEHHDKITVLNSKTLCGPQRILVKYAKQMADHHASLTEIVNKLNQMIESSKSFLIPQDFDYLRRGGRLSHFSAFVGRAIHLVPIMTLTKDRKQLCNFAIKRNFKKAIQEIIEYFYQDKMDIHHKLFVSHSIAPALAEIAQTMLKEAFPRTDVSILHLSPAFTTQGGPGCIAIQSICTEQ